MADSRASDSAGDGEEDDGEDEDVTIDTRQGPDSRFPPGFHFTPNDQELILYYLRKWIANQQLPYDVFNDVNLYEYHPAQLVEKFKECGANRWYFFSPRDRKYPNGIRPNRKTVDGYWKATGPEKKILSNGTQIGIRKALVFYIGKAGKGTKTDWIMYEYINEDSSGPRRPDGTMKLDDWVLCTIQKKRGADEDKISGAPEESSKAQATGQSTKKSRTSHVREVEPLRTFHVQIQHDREMESQVQQLQHCREVEPLRTSQFQIQPIQHELEPPRISQLQIQHYREVEPLRTSQLQIQQIQHGREVEPLNYQVIHNNNISTQVPPSDFMSSGDYCPSVQNFQHNFLNPSVQSSMQNNDLGYYQNIEGDFQENLPNSFVQSNDLGYYPSVQNFQQNYLNPSVQSNDLGYDPSAKNSQQNFLNSMQNNDLVYQLNQTSEFGFENISRPVNSLPMDQYQQDPIGQNEQDRLDAQLQSIFGCVDDRDDSAEVLPSQDIVYQPSEDNDLKDNFINNSNSDKEDVKDSKPIQ